MNKQLSFIILFICLFIWGTSFLVLKTALNDVNPGFLILSRSGIAALFLLPLAFPHLKIFNKKAFIFSILTGIVVGLGYLTQAIGLKYTTPGKSAFLENVYCIVIPLLTCILVRKKPTISTFISIIMCLVGIVFISLDSIDGSFGIGEILSLIAGILYGINITLTGLYTKKLHPITFTWLQFVTITVFVGLYTLIFEDNSTLVFTLPVTLNLLYLGVVVTALAWICRNYALKVLNPITVSLLLPFCAIIGTIASVIAKQDVLTLPFVLGGLLITASIILDTLFEWKKQKNETIEGE